eukprot:m.206663 g.206663  ORF g.206663 m.206663 type:complete len:64 (+) comp17108_c0_seq2:26-217(+)
MRKKQTPTVADVVINRCCCQQMLSTLSHRADVVINTPSSCVTRTETCLNVTNVSIKHKLDCVY